MFKFVLFIFGRQLWRNILDKFSDVSKLDLSLEYFGAYFAHFLSATVKIMLLDGWLKTCNQSKPFRDFLKTLNFLRS